MRDNASVAQGIEHRSPKAGVDGSNPPGGTIKYYKRPDFGPLAVFVGPISRFSIHKC